MERSINELTKQVGQLKALEAEAVTLREAKATLTQQLEQRNRTVADLRAALQVWKNRGKRIMLKQMWLGGNVSTRCIHDNTYMCTGVWG